MFRRVQTRLMGALAFAAVLVSSAAPAAGPTHEFEASVPGRAQFLYNGPAPTWTSLTASQVRIRGFSNTSTAVVVLDGAEPTGDVTGYFYAFRTVAKSSGPKKNVVSEHLFGSVTGTASDTGNGMHYTGTITLTSGTGRLEGATGTIGFEAFQYGYLDPIFEISPDQVPIDIAYEGSYSL